MRTDPRHLPDWRREQNEADEQTEREYWERFDRYMPLNPDDHAPWNESEEGNALPAMDSVDLGSD